MEGTVVFLERQSFVFDLEVYSRRACEFHVSVLCFCCFLISSKKKFKVSEEEELKWR
jgi:hypothetical protein